MVWAVISLLIACVIAASILALGKSAATRSIDENASRQAYLTARSAVDAVVSQIEDCTAYGASASVPDFGCVLIPDDLNGSVTADQFSFPGAMGDCTVTVTRTGESELTVEAVAQVGGMEQKVRGILACGYGGGSGNSQEALVDSLLGGLYTEKVNFERSSNLVLAGSTDMRLTDIEHSGANNSSITVGGTLYTDVNVTGGSLKSVPVTYGSAIEDADAAEGGLIESYTLPYAASALSDNSGSFTLLEPAGGVGCFVLTKGASSLVASGTPDSDGVIRQSSAITVSGSGCYLLKVTAGCTLNLTLQKTGSGTPRVYIFLDGASGSSVSTLNLYSIASGIDVYICGGTGSAVLVRSAISMTGFVTADTFTLYNSYTLTYKPSNLASAVSSGGSTTVTYFWSFEKYD